MWFSGAVPLYWITETDMTKPDHTPQPEVLTDGVLDSISGGPHWYEPPTVFMSADSGTDSAAIFDQGVTPVVESINAEL